jgi:hypothetical protein
VIFVGESGLREVYSSVFRRVQIEIPARLRDFAAMFFDRELVWVRRPTAEWDLLERMTDSACRVDRARGDFTFVPPRIVDGGQIFEITLISDSLLAVAPPGAIPSSIVEVHPSSRAAICVREVEIPASVEIVEGFSGWDSLESVTFAISGRLREMRGFCESISLCRIEIPDSVELIGGRGQRGCFAGCSALAEVLFGAHGHLREIDGFSDCVSLVRLDLPVSLELINGFNRCAALVEVTFPADGRLRRIDGFSDCVSLVRIEIPASVEALTGFNVCRLLSEVHFASLGRVKEITGFQKCESLREVEIPQSIERITENGFLNCQSLRKVTFAGGDHLRTVSGFKLCPLEEVVVGAGGRAHPLGGRIYFTFEDESSIAQHRRNFQMRTSGLPTLEEEEEDEYEYRFRHRFRRRFRRMYWDEY